VAVEIDEEINVEEAREVTNLNASDLAQNIAQLRCEAYDVEDNNELDVENFPTRV